MYTIAATRDRTPDDAIPAPAPTADELLEGLDATPAYFRLDARESGSAWAPAIAGPLNRTPDDDETASTFATAHEAMKALYSVVMPSHPAGVRIVRSDGMVLLRMNLRGE